MNWNLAERVYVARYADDGEKSLAAALDKTTVQIKGLLQQLKRTGDWDLYRNLTDEEYEKIILAAERREQHGTSDTARSSTKRQPHVPKRKSRAANNESPKTSRKSMV